MRMGENQRAGLLLILAFLLSCGSDSGSSGPGPADRSELAIVSNRDGDPEIFVMNADGRNAVSVATNSSSDYAPSWSPDGSKIVFTSYTPIVLAPLETCSSGFVPDEDEPPPPEIHVMNADGSDQIRLTRISPGSNCPTWSYGPTWSPDGNQIAFSSSRDGVGEIYVIEKDGSGETNITNTPYFLDEHPTWSPDGNQIAFTSYRFDFVPPIPAVFPQIYVMNTDGTSQTRLTTNDEANDERPAWSPDGNQIAFDSDRDGNTGIYVIERDGSNQRKITDDSSAFYPAWSSDGSRISFTSNRDGHSQVYVMEADGSGQKAITSGESWSSAASWKPETP